MADVITPNYNFTIPEIGSSNNTWGIKLNANWSSIDTVLGELNAAQDIAQEKVRRIRLNNLLGKNILPL